MKKLEAELRKLKMEIDDIMVPFALEVAEVAGGMTGVSLENVTYDFLGKFKLRFRGSRRIQRRCVGRLECLLW